MLITKTRCAFRKHYVSGAILVSTMFTLISFLVVITLGIKLIHDPRDVIDWVLMIAAIPLIRTEISHYREITQHLSHKRTGSLGSNSIHLTHKKCSMHKGSNLTRARRK